MPSLFSRLSHLYLLLCLPIISSHLFTHLPNLLLSLKIYFVHLYSVIPRCSFLIQGERSVELYHNGQ